MDPDDLYRICRAITEAGIMARPEIDLSDINATADVDFSSLEASVWEVAAALKDIGSGICDLHCTHQVCSSDIELKLQQLIVSVDDLVESIRDNAG